MHIRELLKCGLPRFFKNELLETVLSDLIREFCIEFHKFFREVGNECDRLIGIQENERDEVVFWNSKIDDILERIIKSVEVVETAIKNGALIDERYHEKFIKIQMNEGVDVAVKMKQLSVEEDYAPWKLRLEAAYNDFARFYHKYLNCLRLYDIKNHTNVLKPQKL
jgi:hypothetical protein